MAGRFVALLDALTQSWAAVLQDTLLQCLLDMGVIRQLDAMGIWCVCVRSDRSMPRIQARAQRILARLVLVAW
jgi:hypothetical protein